VLLILGGIGYYFFYYQTYHFGVVQPGVLYRDGLQGLRRFRTRTGATRSRACLNLQSDADLATKYGAQEAAEREFLRYARYQVLPHPHERGSRRRTDPSGAPAGVGGAPENQPVLMHGQPGRDPRRDDGGRLADGTDGLTPQQALNKLIGLDIRRTRSCQNSWRSTSRTGRINRIEN